MSDSDKGSRGRRKHRAAKDRVLQARIPQHLDTELRDRAEQWGLSVSTVVRNVLLNTFDLVEGVVADSAQLARVVQGRENLSLPPPASGNAEPEGPAEVIGWQQAILNKNGICEQCNTILPRGEQAAVGLPIQQRPVLLCLDCLAALSTVDSPSTKKDDPQAKPAPLAKKSSRSRNKPIS